MNRLVWWYRIVPTVWGTVLVLTGAAFGQLPGLSGPGAEPIRFQVWTDQPEAVPGGTVQIHVKAELDEGWHVYAATMAPLAAGPRPAQFELTEPAGAELLDLKPDRAPMVKFEEVFQLQTEYFEREVVWTLTVRLPQRLPAETTVQGVVHYQICTESQCLPPAKYEFAVPVRIKQSTVPAGTETDGSEPPATQPPSESATRTEYRSIGSALAFGFLAGLILNVMPCVLPVLSLKIYGFVQQSAQDPRRTKALALTFAAGIIFVFLILAALAWGLALGWGQQFQSKTFIVVMVGLLVAFAMGLFDVYTIRLPGFVSRAEGELAHEETYLASFLKGMLATVLATPCSGPFLGGVLTFAVQQPPLVVFSVFAAIGVGMASPYVVLAWFPGWARILPKPGEWMNVLKEAMGFLLLGAALWLLWTRRSDGPFVLWTAAFGVCVAFACWLYGRLASPMAGALRRRLAPAFAAGSVAVGWWLCLSATGVLQPRSAARAAQPTSAQVSREQIEEAIDQGVWLEYRRDLLDRLLREGYSVIVDWTADW